MGINGKGEESQRCESRERCEGRCDEDEEEKRRRERGDEADNWVHFRPTSKRENNKLQIFDFGSCRHVVAKLPRIAVADSVPSCDDLSAVGAAEARRGISEIAAPHFRERIHRIRSIACLDELDTQILA